MRNPSVFQRPNTFGVTLLLLLVLGLGACGQKGPLIEPSSPPEQSD